MLDPENTDFDKLRQMIYRLQSLIHDPRPGLFHWSGQYQNAVNDLLKFYEAAPSDETT